MKDQFKVRDNGFDEIRKKILLRTAPIALLAAIGGLAISHFNTNGHASDINVLPFVLPIVLGALTFGMIKGIKRQKGIFNSYTLTIDETEITREQDITSLIKISIKNITQITKNSNGSFAIMGKTSTEVIGVPAQIENVELLESRLSKIKAIDIQHKKTFIRHYIWLLPITTIGLMAAVYISNNKLIVGICGTTLLAFLIYSFIAIRRSKHIDNKTKRNMWLVFIVIFSFIAIMYYKLIG